MTILASCGKTNQWSKEVTENFMSSCLQSGAPKKFCSCVLKKFQAKKKESDFIAFEVEAGKGSREAKEEMISVANQCRS